MTDLVGAMITVLDVDLDFFVSPIANWRRSSGRLPEGEYRVDSVEAALAYLQKHCQLPDELPGVTFEDHDELFDYAVEHFTEPVHLIHLDAHADIAGGFTDCYQYVFTEYTHLSPADRKHPKRRSKFLNCGNFIVFLAGCGLLERVTFVSPPGWTNDYQAIYMQDFREGSNAIQLKRFSKENMQRVGIFTRMWDVPHEVEAPVPFVRIPSSDFYSERVPDHLCVTRSPGYTPASADWVYEAIARHVQAN